MAILNHSQQDFRDGTWISEGLEYSPLPAVDCEVGLAGNAFYYQIPASILTFPDSFRKSELRGRQYLFLIHAGPLDCVQRQSIWEPREIEKGPTHRPPCEEDTTRALAP